MVKYLGSGNPVIYIHDDFENAGKLLEAAGGGFTLGVVDGIDWNWDLSPWRAEKAFKSGEDFSGGGGEYLAKLTRQIIPEAEATLGFRPEIRGITGYSLAGLFALYAFIKSDMFGLAGSVSGSLWFDGWIDYLAQNMNKTQGKIYLSVGGNESHARNRRMKCVEENTRLSEALFRGAGIGTYFELNIGGHFDDPEGRIAKCLKWLKSNS